MEYKNIVDDEIKEIRGDRKVFTENIEKEKNNFAEYIKRSIPAYIKEKEEEKNNKIKGFFKRLIRIL